MNRGLIEKGTVFFTLMTRFTRDAWYAQLLHKITALGDAS
jgi:hypothetical protein